jgi:formate-dependent nitrite reductase membrane component NrfD
MTGPEGGAPPTGAAPSGAAGRAMARADGGGRSSLRRRRRGQGGDGAPVVPDATFTSYYGRPVLKASPWQQDIPAYLFLGGLAAGSSLLGAGADLTDRPALRRAGRLAGLTGITLGFAALVHDLGRPSRFVNMLRVAKPTSPMSVGTWILSVYGPLVGVAGAAEIAQALPPRFGWAQRLLGRLGRPAGIGAAVVAPAVASYMAVLLADTATPAWHEAYHELPFVFAGSAAAASGGLAMMAVTVDEAGPARRMALAGAVGELAAERRMDESMGLAAEALHTGTPGRLMRASKAMTVAGVAAAAAVELLSPRRGSSRWVRAASVAGGAALVAGSICTRFAIFGAGQESARDPKYTVVPQRARLDRRGAAEELDRRAGSEVGAQPADEAPRSLNNDGVSPPVTDTGPPSQRRSTETPARGSKVVDEAVTDWLDG